MLQASRSPEVTTTTKHWTSKPPGSDDAVVLGGHKIWTKPVANTKMALQAYLFRANLWATPLRSLTNWANSYPKEFERLPKAGTICDTLRSESKFDAEPRTIPCQKHLTIIVCHRNTFSILFLASHQAQRLAGNRRRVQWVNQGLYRLVTCAGSSDYVRVKWSLLGVENVDNLS